MRPKAKNPEALKDFQGFVVWCAAANVECVPHGTLAFELAWSWLAKGGAERWR
jgi:hypothetical protein